MGEDWNGLEGGNSDLGKPVYATANGVVVLARNMRMGWGNLVIIRHIFLEEKQMKTVDSVYAHLDRIFVAEGKQIVRGQQIGTIGTNRGMYVAHLHFELRKNIFIAVNTFNIEEKGALAMDATGGRSGTKPERGISSSPSSSASPPLTPSKKKEQFRVNRFSDPFWNQ